MSNVIREFYFADALYFKDIENSTEMNTDLIGKILQWRHDDPEGVQISNSLGWQSKDTMSYRDEFHQITFNGTTTGRAGSKVTVTNIAADKWHVEGTLLCTGNPATPFS